MEAGVSLAQLLDLKGALKEAEARIIIAKVVFVIKLMYNNRAYPRELSQSKILIQFNDHRLDKSHGSLKHRVQSR